MSKTTKITGKMTIGEVVEKYPQTIQIFFDLGLHCVGCFAASNETIEQGAKSHGINIEDFLVSLNKAI